ncbi:unnamed protein product [Schistosoma curassoni]|uniref:Uncharacterized protein n=1 Tax=Schistosoma curassoni TaxID=6186 RepID=A0A183KT42_9TREM|nr:unnamed protein product [Schistosoma curassoni]
MEMDMREMNNNWMELEKKAEDRSNVKLLPNVCQNGYYSTNFFEITIFIFDGQSYKESGVKVNTKKSSSLLGRIFGFSLSSNNNKSNIDEVKSIEIQQEIKAKGSIDNPACGELKELIVEKASGFTITPEGASLCMAVNL